MKFILTGLLLTAVLLANSQDWVGLSLGSNFSRMNFKNSEDVKSHLGGKPGINATFFYIKTVAKEKRKRFPSSVLLATGIGYRTVHIQEPKNGIQSNWSLHFLTGSFGIRRNFNSKHKTNPFVAGGFSLDHLLSGIQTNGLEQFDLTDILNKYNASATVELGLTHFQSQDTFSEIKLRYSRGISNLEKDENQKALVHSISIIISVFFEFYNRK